MPILLKRKELSAVRLRYITEQQGICPMCEQNLVNQRPTLDHDHTTGHVRAALCSGCNRIEGAIKSRFKRYGLQGRGVSMATVFRNLADYLEKDYTHQELHPAHLEDDVKRFKAKTKPKQVEILEKMGVKSPTGTKPILTKMYKDLKSLEFE